MGLTLYYFFFVFHSLFFPSSPRMEAYGEGKTKEAKVKFVSNKCVYDWFALYFCRVISERLYFSLSTEKKKNVPS